MKGSAAVLTCPCTSDWHRHLRAVLQAGVAAALLRACHNHTADLHQQYHLCIRLLANPSCTAADAAHQMVHCSSGSQSCSWEQGGGAGCRTCSKL